MPRATKTAGVLVATAAESGTDFANVHAVGIGTQRVAETLLFVLVPPDDCERFALCKFAADFRLQDGGVHHRNFVTLKLDLGCLTYSFLIYALMSLINSF